MTESVSTSSPPASIDLETLQSWTYTFGRAQQLMLEYWAEHGGPAPGELRLPPLPTPELGRLGERQSAFWAESIGLWNRFLDPEKTGAPSPADKDRRFRADAWRATPFFDLVRQTYLLVASHLLGSIDDLEGLSDAQRERLRFATQVFVDAISPSNFAFTNPEVIEKTIESGGENIVAGIQHLLHDLAKGQLTQTESSAFEVGRNIAATPGKVVHETPLFQLIQYSPATEAVDETPILIFPPWINRFYILDLSPEKSFVKWAVEQGLTVFMVSWKSADESMKDVTLDDYVVNGQIAAIDTVRDLLGVKSVNVVGYCVAGTTLAMTLALLAARKQAAKVKSATFFTAQVDFQDAGELKMFVDDEHLALVSTLGEEKGYLDGRYMAATFNLLRGQDLIWSYVTNNYLLGREYTPLDMLYWNSDVTNLPIKWHLDYLTDLYRDNKLVSPGGIKVAGTGIDLDRIKTPAYIQAGRDDHIAPAKSVWKATGHFAGPLRFVLAGSGHIAGVVNPPAAGKYQYWTNDHPGTSLESFLNGARETRGSWWPDWRQWIKHHGGKQVPADGARIPGGNPAHPAIEDAPGRYVKTR